MTKPEFSGKWLPVIRPGYVRPQFAADLDALLAAARQDERAACLATVEAIRFDEERYSNGRYTYERALEDAAEAIRARGGESDA